MRSLAGLAALLALTAASSAVPGTADRPQTCLGGGSVFCDETCLLQASRRLSKGSVPVSAAAPAGQAAPSFASAVSPANTGQKVFIGIKSAPGNVERRTTWRRSSCAQRLRAAGFQYAFVLGVPYDGRDLTAHAQGGTAPEPVRNQSAALLEESEQYKDMLVVPMLDQYQDLSDKLLALLHHGYSHVGAEYVMECDDEYCVSPEALLKAIAEHEAKPDAGELYGGSSGFSGTEYASMAGPHNETAPFFSGHAAFLSRGLVKLIVEDDATHSILSAPYGTGSDDANVGKWIRYAEEKHGVRVDVKGVKGLLTDVATGKPAALLQAYPAAGPSSSSARDARASTA